MATRPQSSGRQERQAQRRHAAPRKRFALLRLVIGGFRPRRPAPQVGSSPALPQASTRRQLGSIAGLASLAGIALSVFLATGLDPIGVRLHVGLNPLHRAAAETGPPAKDLPPTTLINRNPVTPGTIVPPDGLPSDQRRLVRVKTIWGDIAPKSIVNNGAGLFFAQNMMYRHSITVYDRSFRLVATISDAVRLADFGLAGPDYTLLGAPVEAAATSDGSKMYVSNYEMEGPGYRNPGNDNCGNGGWDNSFVYRIDVGKLAIDQVIAVGAVPKYLAITPDDRTLLVANWCSYDLSVIDVATGVERRRIDLGPYPRGIAIDARRNVAYVAVMGSADIAVLDLATFNVSWIYGVGPAPRHVVLDPSGDFLYVTLNQAGQVAKIDLARRQVLNSAYTGEAPRSMAIAADGASLYVCNYSSNTVSKVSTATMTVLQTVDVIDQPIGITYDEAARSVWVSIYSGAIQVFEDRSPQR